MIITIVIFIIMVVATAIAQRLTVAEFNGPSF
jgi:hypothetical protein